MSHSSRLSTSAICIFDVFLSVGFRNHSETPQCCGEKAITSISKESEAQHERTAWNSRNMSIVINLRPAKILTASTYNLLATPFLTMLCLINRWKFTDGPHFVFADLVLHFSFAAWISASFLHYQVILRREETNWKVHQCFDSRVGSKVNGLVETRTRAFKTFAYIFDFFIEPYFRKFP